MIVPESASGACRASMSSLAEPPDGQPEDQAGSIMRALGPGPTRPPGIDWLLGAAIGSCYQCIHRRVSHIQGCACLNERPE